jgi:membrane protease subunit HflK
MSDQPPIFEPGAPPPPPPRTEGRSASVDLRRAELPDDAPESLMDPAAKSLADALRVTYTLLQGAMVVLVVLFLLSGFQSVNAGERAVRLLFGARSGGDLGPGFQWSAPHPIGELVKVQVAAPLVTLDTDFWPLLADNEKSMTAEQLAGGGRDALDPVTDGSVITGEGFLAHVKAQVKYRRDDPAKYLRALHDGSETALVSAAVRRGIVRAAASLTMDQVLARQPLEERALAVAQETLDAVDCGLTIEQLTVPDAMPPRRVATEYYKPQSAEAERAKALQDAEAERERILHATAGPAAAVILEQIDRYEEQVRLGDRAAAERTQAVIDALLAGEPATIDGERVTLPVYGRVKQVLEEARLERLRTVSAAASDAERFAVIRRSFAANPDVVLSGEWADSVRAFATRRSVQLQMMPAGLRSLVLMINRDPILSKEQYEDYWRQRNLQIREEVRQRRARENLERRVTPAPAVAQ